MLPNVRGFLYFFLPSFFGTTFNVAMSLKIKTFSDIFKAKSDFFINNEFLNCGYLYCKIKAQQTL